MNRNEETQVGYDKASKFEKEINQLLVSHPIKNYPWMWLTLSRTIISGLQLIHEKALEVTRDTTGFADEKSSG